jgi:hypothetical protein
MQKKLTLTHPDEDTGQREFAPGRDGVTGVFRADGGYAIERGTERLWFPDHRVSSFFEDLRPGMLEEPPEDTAKYGSRGDDGRWSCALCSKPPYDTLHALKIHHGRSH